MSALIKRQKSSFPWQRSHDERIVPPACWTSADRGEPLSCAQPLPHSTAAVINSTAAAHLSCGLRLHCMCAPVDPPPPPLHALHTLVRTASRFHNAHNHRKLLFPVARPPPFSSISICTCLNRVHYRPTPNGATLAPSQSL